LARSSVHSSDASERLLVPLSAAASVHSSEHWWVVSANALAQQSVVVSER
jgi:hypothetical protein